MIDTLLACATCASNGRDGTNAIGWSILFLLAVIVPLLGVVAFCMFRLAKRSSASLDPELQDDFQPGSTSKPH